MRNIANSPGHELGLCCKKTAPRPPPARTGTRGARHERSAPIEPADNDPHETREWLDAPEAVSRVKAERAHYLLRGTDCR